MPLIIPRQISLKSHPQYTEAWLRDVIREKPSILNLGEDVEVVGIEIPQPGGGRLDMLLHDQDLGKRYEVELMLGSVDESHIIRCIEYWDLERKRYRQYAHTAVIIAEDILSRFLNVIQLFNNNIPLIALKLTASEIGNDIALQFVKVLDEVIPGEDPKISDQKTDESYWQDKASKETVDLAKQCLSLMHTFNNSLRLNFNKYYVGLGDEYRSNNFVIFRPKVGFLRVEVRLEDLAGLKQSLEEKGFEADANSRDTRVVFRLKRGDIERHRDLLTDIFRKSHEEGKE